MLKYICILKKLEKVKKKKKKEGKNEVLKSYTKKLKTELRN